MFLKKGRRHTLEMEAQAQARRIGILGGTFDPIHYGHLVIAEEVRATLDLAEVIFIPAGAPPHKQDKTITPALHRLAMLELALASNSFFRVSGIEIDRSGPSYTVDTLRQLRTQMGTQTELYFVVGWDSLEDLPDWHDPSGILAELTHLVAVRRPGYNDDATDLAYEVQYGYYEGDAPDPGAIDEDFLDGLEDDVPGIRERLLVVSAPQLEIAASDLRKRVATGHPIKYQTPEAVERYIIEHGLYR